MNVLFITIGRLADIHAPGIYTDLLRHFRQEGHEVYIACSRQRRFHEPTAYIDEDGYHFLRIRIGNITQCGLIEKGISTVFVQRQYIQAISKYLRDVQFDLVIYTTPPITFLKAVKYVKKRDGAKTYLLLKDIFPQNAVDIGMMQKTGLKGILYQHFRKQEKALYTISDHIGCMSPANVAYVTEHNPEIDPRKVEVCPNSINPIDMSCTEAVREEIRKKYDIPMEKKVFAYGGNLGKPQGIPFLIRCLRKCRDIEQAYFLIIGSGTDYQSIEDFITKEEIQNVKLMHSIPKTDYDRMLGSCDVGLVFLDHRFTIPNFPSRLLGYMQAKIPVLACTDPNTDIGRIAAENGFGWECESNDEGHFAEMVSVIVQSDDLKQKGTTGYDYMMAHYTTGKCYETIMNSVTG